MLLRYDIWCKNFSDIDEWPSWWECAREYFSFEKDCEDMDIDELLGLLNKTELLTIAERFNLGKIKSRSEKFIYNKLLEVIKPDDEETKHIIYSKIIEGIPKKDIPKSLVREKKFLYQRTLMFIASGTRKKNEWEGWGIKKAEFLPGLDTCSFCNKLAGIYPISEIPIPGKDTHPGCMCSFTTKD